MNSFSRVAAALLLVSSPLVVTGAPEAEAAAGRELVKKFADVVIGVELVQTLKIKSRDREMPPSERRIESNGTVISSSGLTVTSLAQVDPQASFEAVKATNPNLQIELLNADVKEVKLRLADGTEVPAKFVFKDADLDLAFMAPDLEADSTKRDYPHVQLEASTEGKVLSTYYYISRASKALQRIPIIRATEVFGIVERPRRLYLLTEQSLGSPVLDAQGKILGISLQNFAGGRPTGMVVLPAADIAEMAKQAADASKPN
jgi:S1-C subfamily serine protease